MIAIPIVLSILAYIVIGYCYIVIGYCTGMYIYGRFKDPEPLDMFGGALWPLVLIGTVIFLVGRFVVDSVQVGRLGDYFFELGKGKR